MISCLAWLPLCWLAVVQEGPAKDPAPTSGQSSSLVEASPLTPAMPRLIDLMRAGVLVQEPNTSFTSRMQRDSVFAGSYDWHSCVIAHWALLVHARLTDDATSGAWVRDRIGLAALTHESESLQQRPDKLAATAPYDEAWFLMLLSELGRHPADDPRDPAGLLALRELHEKRLLTKLEDGPFPERHRAEKESRPLFVGFYKSWLWTYLLVRWSEPVSERGSSRLAKLRTDRLLPARASFLAELEPFKPHPYDFLWVPALFALESGDDNYDPGVLSPWPKDVSLRNVHVLGRELSRLWPATKRRVYIEGVTSLLAREDLWAGDFAVVSHWMPQFLFISHWLALGRP